MTYEGDCKEVLKTLPEQSVHCVVTSPPYFGLRDYGVAGQIGQEKTPQEYVATLVAVFEQVRRVLREDGTLWLNLGDSYAASGKGGNPESSPHQATTAGSLVRSKRIDRGSGRWVGGGKPVPVFKPKDLIGIPWRVALALQEAGWYLRSDIIWAKPNCMPESVTDRPTRSHEYIFLLSKCAKYFYDAAAIMEPCSESTIERVSQDVENQIGSLRANGGGKTNGTMKAVARAMQIDQSGDHHGQNARRFQSGSFSNDKKQRGHSRRHAGLNDRWDKMTHQEQCSGMRNKRDVWTVSPAQYSDAHFATFPPDLIKPCILAGCPVGGVVLDPFAGSGTTGMVALELGRKAVLIELNPEYIKLIEKRTFVTPGLPLVCE